MTKPRGQDCTGSGWVFLPVVCFGQPTRMRGFQAESARPAGRPALRLLCISLELLDSLLNGGPREVKKVKYRGSNGFEQPKRVFVQVILIQAINHSRRMCVSLDRPLPFTLSWLPGNNRSDSDPGLTLEGALPSQLGLTLRHAKGQVEILVVDHVEKTPTEN